MPITIHQDLNAYKGAIKDVVLRVLFALIILVVGYWAPSRYFDKFPMLSLYGPGDLAEAAFMLSKVSALAYGAMAMWSIHLAVEALWHPQTNRDTQEGDST